MASLLGYGVSVSDSVPSDGQKIKDTYNQYHNELTSLETRQGELKKQLAQDYGLNGEFLALRDRWGLYPLCIKVLRKAIAHGVSGFDTKELHGKKL